jgi:hypothetical protein
MPVVSEASHPSADGAGPPSGRRALVFFALILAVVHLPLFLGRIIFTRDIAHWIFPARQFVRQLLLAGELPVWNPYQGLGIPVLGDPLYGVFYPPNALLLLVPTAWVPNALTALHFTHMVWGGLGVFLLARRLRATPLASAVGALAWSLSGYMTAQWTAGLLLQASAWIPWIAVGHLALQGRLRAGGRRWTTGLAMAALPTGMALLLGEAFLVVMGLGFAVGVLAVVQIFERREDPAVPRVGLRQLAMHALAVALAIGMGAVVLVPARAVLAGSPRATALSRADAEASSLHPLRVLEFVAPGSMGDVYGDYPAAHVVGEPRLDGLPLSYSVYLGASVLGLALIALRRRALELGLLALTGFALLIALGRHLPVHRLIRRLVPPLAYMRFPEKYMSLVVVGVALLAGLGAARLLSGERQPWRRTAMLLLFLVATGVAAPFVFPFPWSGFVVVGLRHGAVAVLALLGVQVLAARASRLAPALLLAVVALDLAVSSWGLQNFVPRAVGASTPPAARLVEVDHGAHAEPARIYRSPAVDGVLNRRAPASNAAEGELRLLATLIPNTVNVWGIASLPGYDAALPASLDRLWNAGANGGVPDLSTLRLLGADYAVLPAPDARGTHAAPPGLEPLADLAPGVRLFRVTGSLPPVFLAGRGEALADDEALRKLFDPAVVAGEVALLAPRAPALAGAVGRGGTCRLTGYSPGRLSAHCQVAREALAVFVEQYAPGWQAVVDGRPARIERANLVMRALRLGPGAHDILLAYRAPGLLPGLALSLLGLTVCVGLIVAGRVKRQSEAGTPPGQSS